MKPSDEERRMLACQRDIENELTRTLDELRPAIAAKHGIDELRVHTATAFASINVGITMNLKKVSATDDLIEAAKQGVALVLSGAMYQARLKEGAEPHDQ
jgi:hypothetical protein